MVLLLPRCSAADDFTALVTVICIFIDASEVIYRFVTLLSGSQFILCHC